MAEHFFAKFLGRKRHNLAVAFTTDGGGGGGGEVFGVIGPLEFMNLHFVAGGRVLKRNKEKEVTNKGT